MPAAVIGPTPGPRDARAGRVRRLTRLIAAGLTGLAGIAAVLRPARVAVRGGSMLPTLLPGDHLVVLRWPRPVPGDLVLVRAPAGDESGPGRVVVKRLAEAGPRGLVVLGDNPSASTDSRSWGPLPRRALRGRVVYRYAPRERAGPLPPSR